MINCGNVWNVVKKQSKVLNSVFYFLKNGEDIR
ncbi:MAG: hypothetical protein CHKLHMKO_00140 [Candidatus Argoarchaeum ethanivorans]|uniref:Uncharacterized protein n=1 Tax=Candidatus Argoarchaeum ethanivorans TaxID=2608793 RepID=A0A811TAC5_9EURY|nr:MAG: hypothetical protein CHKLHMKO_00140 [Candidatus Argoarchaeum ethanivorans]